MFSRLIKQVAPVGMVSDNRNRLIRAGSDKQVDWQKREHFYFACLAWDCQLQEVETCRNYTLRIPEYYCILLRTIVCLRFVIMWWDVTSCEMIRTRSCQWGDSILRVLFTCSTWSPSGFPIFRGFPMLPWFCVHLPLQLRPGHSGGLICSVRAGCWKHVAILNMCQIQSDSVRFRCGQR